jgi:RES domain-containing protein
VAVRALREALRVYRIGDPDGRFEIYSGEGAARCDGRWHERGVEVIYTSEHYSTAMLEKLAHYNGLLPPNQHYISIEIPVGTTYEEVTKDSLSGWDHMDQKVSRSFGTRWLIELRSAILIVPSVIAREESNVLINPRHPDAKGIRVGRERPVSWDARLFADPGTK